MVLAMLAWASIRQDCGESSKSLRRRVGGLPRFKEERAKFTGVCTASACRTSEGTCGGALTSSLSARVPDKASIMWSQQKAMEEANHSNEARVLQDGGLFISVGRYTATCLLFYYFKHLV